MDPVQLDEAALLAAELMVYLLPEAKGEENAMKIARAVCYTIFGADTNDSRLTATQAAALKVRAENKVREWLTPLCCASLARFAPFCILH